MTQTQPSWQELMLEHDQGVLVVTLNRPDSLNTLSSVLKTELLQVLKDCQANTDVKVVVLTGAGRAFCAGGDLNGFGRMDVVQARQHLKQINEIVQAIRNLEKPVVAAVNGFATGAGCNLALACDIILASSEAKFCQSFIKVGLIPDGGGTYHLPRLVGLSKAKDLIFTGRMLTAEEAETWGLVTYVYDKEVFFREVMEYAKKLAKGPGHAMALGKKLLNESMNASFEQMLESERMAQTLCMQTSDHKEGLQAFFEKRAPNFT
jgi:2-(1,2-epoxy-1,2-dihydrophenyl)acetyl-CoA isomerase